MATPALLMRMSMCETCRRERVFWTICEGADGSEMSVWKQTARPVGVVVVLLAVLISAQRSCASFSDEGET